jgi:putative phosphoribosyl transferase
MFGLSAEELTFSDRRDAGRKLAALLTNYAKQDDVLVLGIPRGGVQVAFEIATRLSAPLDVFLLRKLGVPGEEELAFGAIASGGVRVLDYETIHAFGISGHEIERVTEMELRELHRRETAYRQGRPPLDVKGRTIILVDDGIATGSSMRAGVQALHQLQPRRIIVAVPVAPVRASEQLNAHIDEFVCLQTPMFFQAIGQFYDDFSQVPDEEVLSMLNSAPQPARQKVAAGGSG